MVAESGFSIQSIESTTNSPASAPRVPYLKLSETFYISFVCAQSHRVTNSLGSFTFNKEWERQLEISWNQGLIEQILKRESTFVEGTTKPNYDFLCVMKRNDINQSNDDLGSKLLHS